MMPPLEILMSDCLVAYQHNEYFLRTKCVKIVATYEERDFFEVGAANFMSYFCKWILWFSGRRKSVKSGDMIMCWKIKWCLCDNCG